MICDQKHLFLETILLCSFQNLTKCVAHDCDDHVHEDDRNNECGKEEHQHHSRGRISNFVSARRKVAQSTYHIYRNKRIDDFVVEIGRNVAVFLS